MERFLAVMVSEKAVGVRDRDIAFISALSSGKGSLEALRKIESVSKKVQGGGSNGSVGRKWGGGGSQSR